MAVERGADRGQLGKANAASSGLDPVIWIFYSEPLPAARNLLILLRRVWNLALT
jgi:hypothetical protein